MTLLSDPVVGVTTGRVEDVRVENDRRGGEAGRDGPGVGPGVIVDAI